MTIVIYANNSPLSYNQLAFNHHHIRLGESNLVFCMILEGEKNILILQTRDDSVVVRNTCHAKTNLEAQSELD